MKKMKDLHPEFSNQLPNKDMNGNDHAGRQGWGSDSQVSISCKTAWDIYNYFVQDFVCLGYEMPTECLKEECRLQNQTYYLDMDDLL